MAFKPTGKEGATTTGECSAVIHKKGDAHGNGHGRKLQNPEQDKVDELQAQVDLLEKKFANAKNSLKTHLYEFYCKTADVGTTTDEQIAEDIVLKEETSQEIKELKERCIRAEINLSTEIGTIMEELSAREGDILKLKKKIRHAESEKMKLIIQLREKEEEVEQLKKQRDLLQKRYNKMKEANFMLRNEKDCYKGSQERSTLDKILEMETSLSTESEQMARRKELFRNLKFEKNDYAPLIKLDEDMSTHRIAVMDMFCAKRDIARYTEVICLTLQGRSDLIQEILKTSNLLRSDFDATSILLKKLHEKSNEITTSTIPVMKHAVDGHERKIDIRSLTRNVAEIKTELSKTLNRREEIFIAIQDNIVSISSLKRKISAVNQDENHIQRCASTYLGKVFQEQSTITKFWYKLKAALMYIEGQGKLLEVYRKHIDEETYSHRFLRLLSQVDQNWQVIGEMCSLSCGERNEEANVLYSFADNIVNVNTTT